jgi:SPP1 family predicted phage head-tail adaptor
MSIAAGNLSRRVTIQARTPSQDTFGAQSATWSDLATVWASIEPLTGRELMNAQTLATEISHRITLRYQSAFANPKTVAAYRAVYGARVFDIHASTNESENNERITLLAAEGLTDG